jgi:WD40 repeat protein
MHGIDAWSLPREIATHEELPIACEMHVILSPDGRRIVSGLNSYRSAETLPNENDPRLWDADTGSLIRTLTGHARRNSFGMSADGRRIFTHSGSTGRWGWDAQDGRWLEESEVEDTSDNRPRVDYERGREGFTVTSVATSADGRRVVEGSNEGRVRYWDGEKEVQILQGSGPIVHCVAISGDDSRIAAGSWDGSVQLWDADTGRALQFLTDPENSIDQLVMNEDGRVVVASLHNGPLKVWDTESGEEGELPGYRLTPRNFDMSADGQRIVIARTTGMIEVWDHHVR